MNNTDIRKKWMSSVSTFSSDVQIHCRKKKYKIQKTEKCICNSAIYIRWWRKDMTSYSFKNVCKDTEKKLAGDGVTTKSWLLLLYIYFFLVLCLLDSSPVTDILHVRSLRQCWLLNITVKLKHLIWRTIFFFYADISNLTS